MTHQDAAQIRKVVERFQKLTEPAWNDFKALFSYAGIKKGAFFVGRGSIMINLPLSWKGHYGLITWINRFFPGLANRIIK